jgi:hypothetical protein
LLADSVWVVGFGKDVILCFDIITVVVMLPLGRIRLAVVMAGTRVACLAESKILEMEKVELTV